MVIINQFYQIVDRKTSNVSALWKTAHLITFALAAISGFITAFAVGTVLDIFKYNCILEAQVVFDNGTYLNYTKDGVVKFAQAIDFTYTVWGSTSQCNFVQFTPLFMTISAVIWGAYFGILAKGGAGFSSDLLAKPWIIVYPCLVFTTVAFIICVISNSKLSSGVAAFCNRFQSQFNSTDCVPEINIYLSQFQVDPNEIIFFDDFYTQMKIALISSSIGFWTWLVQLFITIARLFFVADFEVRLVTIETKSEEKVQTVIEFPDMDDEDTEVSQV